MPSFQRDIGGTMILFRTTDKIENNNIIRKGNYVEALNFKKNADLCFDCDLWGVVNSNSNIGDFLDISEGKILQIIKVKANDCVATKYKGIFKFKKGKIIKEYEIPKEGLPQIFHKLKGSILINAGVKWSGVTNKMRIKVFTSLRNDFCRYRAGCLWEGITDKMRIDAFKKFKETEWLFLAGLDWSGITDKMRRDVFKKLKKDEIIYYTGTDWSGITNELRVKALKKLKNKKYLSLALMDWELPTKKQHKTLINSKGG